MDTPDREYIVPEVPLHYTGVLFGIDFRTKALQCVNGQRSIGRFVNEFHMLSGSLRLHGPDVGCDGSHEQRLHVFRGVVYNSFPTPPGVTSGNANLSMLEPVA